MRTEINCLAGTDQSGERHHGKLEPTPHQIKDFGLSLVVIGLVSQEKDDKNEPPRDQKKVQNIYIMD